MEMWRGKPSRWRAISYNFFNLSQSYLYSAFKTEKEARNFKIHFWVDNSVVTVGEGGTYTQEEYENMKYSLRVSIEVLKNNN